jgi:hypothetical protein
MRSGTIGETPFVSEDWLVLSLIVCRSESVGRLFYSFISYDLHVNIGFIL